MMERMSSLITPSWELATTEESDTLNSLLLTRFYSIAKGDQNTMEQREWVIYMKKLVISWLTQMKHMEETSTHPLTSRNS